jgi:hypothetical protein
VPIGQLWALNKPDIGWLALGLLGATIVGVASTLEAYVAVNFLVRYSNAYSLCAHTVDGLIATLTCYTYMTDTAQSRSCSAACCFPQ